MEDAANLKLNKISENKSEADVIICDCDSVVVNTNTNVQETQDPGAIQTHWLYNTPNQSQHDQWSEIEKTQRKMCLKLNLSKEAINEKNNCEHYIENIRSTPSEKMNTGVRIVQQARKSSLDGNHSRFSKTPSSIPRELIGEGYSQSPTLARSPAMHDGFRDRDWKVERTPINTPDSIKNLTSRVPQLSDDDEEEAEETDSVNSETDPISKGSGTSSFLPSSVEVSESRTGSLQEKMLTATAGDTGVICSQSSRSVSDSVRDAEDTGVQEQTLSHEVSASSEESSIVLPPAGFTDSPVKNHPPPGSADIDGSVSDGNEILILEPPKLPEEDLKISAQKQNEAEDYEILGNTKSKSFVQENFDLKESYHHPELVVCQRQGIFKIESFTNNKHEIKLLPILIFL